MSRILIQIILPLIAPFAIYALWLWYAKKRAETTGDEPPAFTRGSAFWSIILGFLLMAGSLAWIAASSGVPAGSGVYEAPRLENGEITEPTYTPKNSNSETSQ
ncbi:MAG: hypothetical protein HON65_00745 [Rhodospirillales bacterium]|jgi:hypothetical protein|nr:hypothetical protein [Rhodospirillales bacterium]